MSVMINKRLIYIRYSLTVNITAGFDMLNETLSKSERSNVIFYHYSAILGVIISGKIN